LFSGFKPLYCQYLAEKKLFYVRKNVTYNGSVKTRKTRICLTKKRIEKIIKKAKATAAAAAATTSQQRQQNYYAISFA